MLQEQQQEYQIKKQEMKQEDKVDRNRALMVADMTTFMAKLVSKLTQTSINYANSLVAKSTETKQSW